MTREDKLYSLKGDMLIAECDKLGVKVSCNKSRTQLKESKSKVVDRILAFEANTADVEKTEKVEKPDTKTERKLVSITGIEKLEALKKEYSYSFDDLKLNLISFCSNHQLCFREAHNKKDIYYIKLNSKSIKLRITKKYYVCYISGRYDTGIFEEKSNRTKYTLTSLDDLLNLK